MRVVEVILAQTTGSGRLTTHVLDTAKGCPAAGLVIELYSVSGDEKQFIKKAVTNSDGRTDAPMLDSSEISVGAFELVFHAGNYIKSSGADVPEIPFLDVVPVQFGISDDTAHYHVPLLVSPYGYSTYRGS